LLALPALAPALAGTAPAAAPAAAQAEAEVAPFPEETRAALRVIVDRRQAQSGAPGAVAGVWIPGRGSWVYAQGVSDARARTPLGASDVFRIASITKTYVATAALQLVDEGRLGLDDPLERHLPGLGLAGGERITVRQTLGMTAGIFSYTEDAAFLAAYAADPLLPFSPEQGIAIARRHPPDFPPGSAFHYSDTNYLIAGLLVERATGRRLHEAVHERVLRPLRLSATSFPTTPELPAPFSRGYQPAAGGGDALKDVTRSNPDVAWGAGAMLANLDDLRLWARALATGALLSPALQAERLRTTPLPGGAALQAGYGLGVSSIAGFVGHNGGIPGYSSIAMHLTEANATIVVLVNQSGLEGGAADAIAWDAVRLLFPGRVPEA
jgi:D-alanyl-D-alanine carboxypeptidase